MTPIETELTQIIKETKFDEKGEVNETGNKTLKDLYDDLAPKEKEYDDAQAVFEQAEEDQKETKKEDRDKAKDLWDKAKTAYDTARRKLTGLCLVKVDMDRENLKRKKFSKAVSEYRTKKSIADREKEIRDLEAEIDVIQLNVDEQDKKIEEIRGTAKAAG